MGKLSKSDLASYAGLQRDNAAAAATLANPTLDSIKTTIVSLSYRQPLSHSLLSLSLSLSGCMQSSGRKSPAGTGRSIRIRPVVRKKMFERRGGGGGGPLATPPPS